MQKCERPPCPGRWGFGDTGLPWGPCASSRGYARSHNGRAHTPVAFAALARVPPLRRPRRHVGSHPGRRRSGPPADQTPGRPGGDWKFRWGLDAVPACRSARGLPQGWGCANEGSPPRPAWLCLAPLPANCQWNFPCCAQTAGLRGEGVGLARPPARCTQGPLNPCWPGFSPSGSQLPPPPPTHLSHRSGQSPPCPPVQLLHEGFTPRPPKGTAWASVC